MLRAVVLATAGVGLSATLPLAADALHSPLSYCVAGVSCALLLFTELDTLWVSSAQSSWDCWGWY